MTQNPDLIRELIDRLLAAADTEGRFTESVARSVEVQFRREFNGAEFYIGCRKQSHPQEVKDAAVNQYKNGLPVNQIIQENGISRAALYRYLKR